MGLGSVSRFVMAEATKIASYIEATIVATSCRPFRSKKCFVNKGDKNRRLTFCYKIARQ